MNIDKVKNIIKNALYEDIFTGDITTDNLIDEKNMKTAVITAKENGILCGIDIAIMTFNMLNSTLVFEILKQDGQKVLKGEDVLIIKGSTKDILKAERVALNFLQRMSGIASKTRKYVEELNDDSIKLVDTRKTTPNLRILEKYAVKIGGAKNHRFGLYDLVMIKDNHIKASGGIKNAVERIKNNLSHAHKIEVETTCIKEVKEAIESNVDIIMLDNMDNEMIKEAIKIIDKKAIIEVSGGIDFERLKYLKNLDIDIISLGTLTHSIKSLDLSLNFK
ncbi:MAG: carboxylating nicotinate-nucleotide diphosphorylase [Peptostreptococcaceae bacterium]|nr:carboxylating nicotinate-nucleotide diphosphorylase [Peptostreptococcaceae bacterium]